MNRIKGMLSTLAKQHPKFQIDVTPANSMPFVGGLVIVFCIVAYGLILLRIDGREFGMWIREDGLAEWLTFFELLMMSIYSFSVSSHFNQTSETRAARRVWLFMGAVMLFGAMEEISWGQRILGIQSPEWFFRHNAQHETNIHNLVLWGIKLNKIIFGRCLTVFIVIYLCVVPLLYRFNKKVKGLIDRWGIPVAQNYQIILFAILAVTIRSHLGLSNKAEELLEFSGPYIFLLILAYPHNLCYKKVKTSFSKTSSPE